MTKLMTDCYIILWLCFEGGLLLEVAWDMTIATSGLQIEVVSEYRW